MGGAIATRPKRTFPADTPLDLPAKRTFSAATPLDVEPPALPSTGSEIPGLLSGFYEGSTGAVAPGETLGHAVARELIAAPARAARTVATTPLAIGQAVFTPPTTPEETAVESFGGTPALVAKRLIYDPSAEEFRKASEGVKAAGGLGAYIGGLTPGGGVTSPIAPALHAAAGLVPVAGPWIGGAISEAEKGHIGAALQFPLEYAGFKYAPKVLAKAFPAARAALETRYATKGAQGIIRATGTKGAAVAEDLGRVVEKGYAREASDIYDNLQSKPQTGPVRLSQNMANAAESFRQVANRVQTMRDDIAARQSDNPVANVPGDQIASAIDRSITPLDRTTFPERLQPILDEAQRYRGKVYDSSEALALSEDLNTQARALYSAKPEVANAKQLAATQRSLRTAADAVRSLIADRLTAAGEDGAGFRELGRDYGALRETHEALRDSVAASVRAEARKPSYASVPFRSVQRHPLLTGGALAAGYEFGEPGVLAVVPLIELVRTAMERRSLPEAEIGRAMIKLGRTAGPGPQLGPTPSMRVHLGKGRTIAVPPQPLPPQPGVPEANVLPPVLIFNPRSGEARFVGPGEENLFAPQSGAGPSVESSYAAGYSIEDIARTFGVPRANVLDRLQKAGLLKGLTK